MALETLTGIRGILVPHAGRSYAGFAREAAFSLVYPAPPQIVYIAALHDEAKPVPDVYILHEDPGFPISRFPSNFKRIDLAVHSFDWVLPELKMFFAGSSILALAPHKETQNLEKWIVDFLENYPSSIVIATADLIHYGARYGTEGVLEKNHPQWHKTLAEEKLIGHLSTYPLDKKQVKLELKKHPFLTCGPKVLTTFVGVMQELGYGGKVVDYYDSSQTSLTTVGAERSLDLYTLLPSRLSRSQEFVSYVSIVYGRDIRQSQIIEFDILAALGILKSTILKQLHGETYSLFFPLWSPFSKMETGVFVGTRLDRGPNCSYGRYEDDQLAPSTAKKIVQASADCQKDAQNRWKLPYTLENLDRHNFKIELLEPKSHWKRYSSQQALSHFKVDGSHGVFLGWPSGKAATFLPVVARENPHWSVEDYMAQLSRKAGGQEDDWRNGTIDLYKTYSYIWEAPKTDSQWWR